MKNFKLYLTFVLTLFFIQSCAVKTQKSAISGLTDEVYFTPSDTRVSMRSRDLRDEENEYYRQPIQNQRNQAGDFTSSYSNRLRYFGSGNTFIFNSYQPVLFTQNNCNPFSNRDMMTFMNQGQMFYGNTFYSPFSPYYGFFGYSEDFWDFIHFTNFSMYNFYFPMQSQMFYNPFFCYQYPYYSLLNNNYSTQNNYQSNKNNNSSSNNSNNNNNNNNNNNSGPWYRSNSDGSSSGSSGRPTTNGSSSSGESPRRR